MQIRVEEFTSCSDRVITPGIDRPAGYNPAGSSWCEGITETEYRKGSSGKCSDRVVPCQSGGPPELYPDRILISTPDSH